MICVIKNKKDNDSIVGYLDEQKVDDFLRENPLEEYFFQPIEEIVPVLGYSDYSSKDLLKIEYVIEIKNIRGVIWENEIKYHNYYVSEKLKPNYIVGKYRLKDENDPSSESIAYSLIFHINLPKNSSDDSESARTLAIRCFEDMSSHYDRDITYGIIKVQNEYFMEKNGGKR